MTIANGINTDILEVFPPLTEALVHYLNNLGEEAKRRFGPHTFSRQGIIDFYTNHPLHHGYVALSGGSSIVAYCTLRMGYLPADRPRLQTYNLKLQENTVATYAPSVADGWQGKGLATAMLRHLMQLCKSQKNVHNLLLWGGVQATNHKAIAFYQKNGFKVIGQFEYNGPNLDMMLQF